MSATITIPLWPIYLMVALYFAIGIVTWIPLVRAAYATLESNSGLPSFWRFAAKYPLRIPVQIALWPVAAWEYRATYVPFSWLPRRLTLPQNPRVHHWLWWNF